MRKKRLKMEGKEKQRIAGNRVSEFGDKSSLLLQLHSRNKLWGDDSVNHEFIL